ncbi:MAG: 2-dehydropantoate 2-reductase, partial [Hyphomicrobiaceae bacterium]|nr:2-dehydropantoate 2-reductase [Hyphomicrobiaceae bacterium]
MAFEDPRVVVIGAGAMGGLFGGLLAEGGLDVTLVDTRDEHIAAIASQGLRIVGVGGVRAIRVKATADAGTVGSADVVLFQCKAFVNDAAAQAARHLFTGQTVAISFQNGLGNEEALSTILGAKNVMGGLTAQAGLVEAPGVVRNFGDLPTIIGELPGGLSTRATAIAHAFTRAGLTTIASADIKRDKWKKLIGNVALGAISAVTDLRSFEIMRVPQLQAIVLRSVDEAAAVAKAEGIALDVAEVREVLMKLVDTAGGGTGTSKSSMREDIVRRRRTEIDTIHRAVQRLARRHA